jgi:hypothetical protein
VSSTGGSVSAYIGGKAAVVIAAVAIAAGAVVVPVVTGGGSGPACTGAAVTTGTFAARVTGASPGDVLCLSSGNYGTWTGANKAITVTAGAGQSPVMKLDFDISMGGLVVDAMTQMQANIGTSAGNFTISNSQFTKPASGTYPAMIYVDRSASTAITIGPGNTFADSGACTLYDTRARIALWGTSTNMVITGNTFGQYHTTNGGGSADGIRADGPGARITANKFYAITDADPCHADPIQWPAGGNTTEVDHNIFDNTGGFVVSYFGAWDGQSNLNIHDNVFKGSGLTSQFIGVYSDTNSQVHNNVFTNENGSIGGDNIASGTRAYDNVMGGTPGGVTGWTFDHNLVSATLTGTGNVVGSATFVGGDPEVLGSWCLTGASAGATASTTGGKVGLTGC